MKKNRFGKAFPDQLNKVSFKFGHFHKHKESESGFSDFLISGRGHATSTDLMSVWRKVFLTAVFLVALAVLLFRLFHLQVIEGSDMRALADSNRIQVRVIHAPRGVIYDRNGKILAQNEPGFRLLESTDSAHKARYLSRDEAVKMEVENDPRFKNLEIDNIRAYPYGEKTSHVLGYVGEITEEELKDPKFINYKPGDKIGRGGIEESYEKVLKGTDGGEIIEVDAQGKKLRTLRKTEPIHGQNLYLSVDSELQSVAFDKLKESVIKSGSCCGALIAQNPQNGEVLALISYPPFDPDDLSGALTSSDSPLLNRVIAGTYPPGSTFKIASSLAGLSSKKITGQTRFEDTGVLALGPFTFANWYFTQYGRREEGGVGIIKALQRSNDIFFYRLGQEIGEQVLADASKKLGLGRMSGIDIPGEASGLIPDNAWKEENIGQSWYPGDTLHMAIGQGYVLSTPIQINNLISIIAADGKQYPPHLALKITSPKGSKIKDFKYDPTYYKDFKSEDIQLVRQGLEAVPKNGGTAWPFFAFPIQTAGKTGTAEFGHPKNKTHAWYTSYAPADAPQIAMTILIEAGGEGSTNASPVAKEIYRWYFSDDKNNLIKDLGPIATESARTLGE